MQNLVSVEHPHKMRNLFITCTLSDFLYHQSYIWQRPFQLRHW